MTAGLEDVGSPGRRKEDDAERVLREKPEGGRYRDDEQREGGLVAQVEHAAVGLVQRDQARRDEVYHESRGENDQLVREVVGAQEFGGGEVGDRVEAHGQVGEAREARQRVGARRLEHELEEPQGVLAHLQYLQAEGLADTETERGERRDDHGARDGGDGVELEDAQGDTHDGAVRNRMEYFGEQELFPELAADEEPVEESVLEQEPERKDQFPLEDVAAPADGARENCHRQCGNGGHGEPELQDVSEELPLGGAFPEKGENQRRHAEIGDGAEDGVVAL